MGGKAETVSENVVQSVEAYANADPLDLPPLYDSIDPNALEASVEAISDGSIQFEYAGDSVTVTIDETTEVSAVPAYTASRAASALDD